MSGEPPTLFGRPVVVSNDVPALGDVRFGHYGSPPCLVPLARLSVTWDDGTPVDKSAMTCCACHAPATCVSFAPDGAGTWCDACKPDYPEKCGSLS